MKKFTKKTLIALATAGILILSIGGAALAAGPNNSTAVCSGTGPSGYGGGANLGLSGQGTCLPGVTQLLDMTVEEIQAERLAGKSLVDIAAEKGITEDALIAAILADREEALDALVADGTITQEQADIMLDRMETNIITMVERTTVGNPGLGKGNGQSQGGTGYDTGGGQGKSNGYGKYSQGKGSGSSNCWRINQ